ncbi:MAG: hypothetical protein U0174_28375 [Polyangiaceae bacterium]
MSVVGPYRSGGDAAALPPSELRLVASTLDLEFARTFKFRQLAGLIGVVACTVLVGVVVHDATWVMATLLMTTALVFFWRGREKKKLRSATLEVRDGRLRLFRGGLVGDLHLSELLRIVLSEEAEAHFTSVGGGVREAMPSGGTGRCFVLLQTANRSLSLLEHPISHTEALEWMSLVRRFLRRNEWDADGGAERAVALAEADQDADEPPESDDDG